MASLVLALLVRLVLVAAVIIAAHTSGTPCFCSQSGVQWRRTKGTAWHFIPNPHRDVQLYRPAVA